MNTLFTLPSTESELLGALREHFRNMPGAERLNGYDLHGLLVGLEGTRSAEDPHACTPLADAAYYTLECTLMADKGDDADLLHFMNFASHAAMQRLITRAHVAVVTDEMDADTDLLEAEEALAASVAATEGLTVINTIKLSAAAAANAAATGADPIADVGRLRAGLTKEALLDECLNGADPEYVPGWHEYVDAIVDAAEREAAPALRNPTARELRAMLYEVGNQDAPLSDEVMASLQAKVPAGG